MDRTKGNILAYLSHMFFSFLRQDNLLKFPSAVVGLLLLSSLILQMSAIVLVIVLVLPDQVIIVNMVWPGHPSGQNLSCWGRETVQDNIDGHCGNQNPQKLPPNLNNHSFLTLKVSKRDTCISLWFSLIPVYWILSVSMAKRLDNALQGIYIMCSKTGTCIYTIFSLE